MKITKELLLEKGFEERQIESQTIYVNGHHALIYILGVWVPCYYGAGTALEGTLCINTIEELDILRGL